jgi:hypothetical protein
MFGRLLTAIVTDVDLGESGSQQEKQTNRSSDRAGLPEGRRPVAVSRIGPPCAPSRRNCATCRGLAAAV